MKYSTILQNDPTAFHLNGDVDLNAHGYDIYNEINPYIKKCDITDADKITLCFAKWGRICVEMHNGRDIEYYGIALVKHRKRIYSWTKR